MTLVTPLGARGENGINAVGTLARFPQAAFDAFGPEIRPEGPAGGESALYGGTLLPVPGAGQLWQVYFTSAFDGPQSFGILVRDAKTLKATGSFRLPEPIRRATASAWGGGEWLHATDGGNRVFLVTQSNALLEVNASTFEVFVRPLPTSAVRVFSPLALAGMTYDQRTDSLLLLYGGPPNNSALNHVTVLQQFDLITGTVANRVVRSCTGPLSATDVWGTTYATAPMADADAVYVPCQQGLLAANFQQPTAIVVRIPRASLLDSTGDETSVNAGGPMNTALLDSGAGRITVLGYFGTMTVVDARTMTAVGSFETTQHPSLQVPVGAGLDLDTGRMFFQSDLGLGYVDARGTGPFVPTVAPSAAAVARERIVSNGKRVYVLPVTGVGFNQKPDHYTIYNVTP